MRRQSRTKTVLGILAGIFIFAFALTDFIYVIKYTQPNPGMVISPTPTPATASAGFNPMTAVTITKVSATSDTITVEYDPVEGATKYSVSFRTGDEEWLSEICEATSLTISVDARNVYEVKVCAVGEGDEYGADSPIKTVATVADSVTLTLSSEDVSSITATWDAVFEEAVYQVEYREAGSQTWNKIQVDTTEYKATGLKKDVSYEFRVTATSISNEKLVSAVKSTTTQKTGYVDPFKDIYGTLNVGSKSKTVLITSPEGCLGAVCWAEYNTKLYTDINFASVVCNVNGGTKLTISADEKGNYVYCGTNNNWAVHVSGNQFSGWIEGCALILDIQDIFRADDNIYTIQYNRTNSYGSIFTCGGNAKKVDNTSNEKSRYNPLNAASGTIALTMGNYNYIKDVTGKKLPNYGSKNQMPVIWDLALELITCQRNALEMGYTLLIYEGYRPNATSQFVYGAMTEAGYLTYKQNNITLANGFLNSNLSAANYIAQNSNHNKAIAVDITIMKFTTVDKLGDEVQMQTKMHTLDFRANMRYNTKEANALKTIMMTDTGLVCLRGKQEWWHFELSTDTSKYPGISKYVFADYEI